MSVLNLNNADALYYGNTLVEKLYKGDVQLYPTRVDPYWDNVVLYLKGDGADNSTDIIDSSPTPKTITRYGDTKISTAQSKYGGSSLFQNTNGYLSTNLGTYGQANFTIEFWAYVTSYPQYSFPIGTFSVGNWHISFIGSGTINVYIGSHLSFSAALPLNQWFHTAVVRNSGVVTVFLNGISKGSQNLATAMTGSTPTIFKRPSDSFYLKGYLDSLRFTDGIARYTSNFNPETDTYLAY